MSTLTVDIVGCGTVVETRHVPVIQLLQGSGDLTIGGCFDLNPDNARRVASLVGAQRWGTDPDPGEGGHVDAVVIATPPGSHAAVATRYIDRGKSVFMEKPLTATAEDARKIVEGARARGVVTAVNHFWRYVPSVVAARELLEGERLDGVERLEATEGFRWSWAAVSDYVTRDPHGGVIHDTGAHVVDTVLFLLGLDEGEHPDFAVEDVSKVPAREPSHECRARLSVRTTRGTAVRVDIGMSRLQPLAQGLKVWDGSGVLFVPTGLESTPLLMRGGNALRLRSADPGQELPENVGDCFLLAYRDFLKAARDGVATRISGERFLVLSEILEALWRAS